MMFSLIRAVKSFALRCKLRLSSFGASPKIKQSSESNSSHQRTSPKIHIVFLKSNPQSSSDSSSIPPKNNMAEESHIVVTVMKNYDLSFVQVRVPERLFDNAMSEKNLFENKEEYVRAYRRGSTPCFIELKRYIEARLGFKIEDSITKNAPTDRPEPQMV